MPRLCAADLLALALPAGTRLLAGHAGLERAVTRPVLMRTRAPAFPRFSGGELALLSTAGLRLLDEPLSLERVLTALHAQGAGAVAVQGTVSPQACTIADTLALPLFALPPDCTLADVERAAARALSDAHAQAYQRSRALYQELLACATAGAGLEAVARRAATLAGSAVAIELCTPSQLRALALPEGAEPLPSHTQAALEAALFQQQPELVTALAAERLDAADPPVLRRTFPARHSAWPARVVAPVVREGTVAGLFSVLSGRDRPTIDERLVAAAGAAVAAVVLAQEEAVLSAEERLQARLLKNLLAGPALARAVLRSSATRLGLDPGRPAVPVTLHVHGSAGILGALREVRRALDALGLRAPAVAQDEVITVVLPGDGSCDHMSASALAERLRQTVAAIAGKQVSAGVSLPAALPELKQRWREAVEALELGRRVLGPGRTASYRQLTLYRLLRAAPDRGELQRFYLDTLGPLHDYDARAGGHLVHTLAVFIECGYSPTAAAARLQMHRNGLLYRLERIRALTGYDLSSPETRLTLEVALRIRRLLDAEAPELSHTPESESVEHRPPPPSRNGTMQAAP
jgi:purine catabolism regulator